MKKIILLYQRRIKLSLTLCQKTRLLSLKYIKRNPKRMQREARRQMQETGIGTKSQQVIDKVTDLQSSYMPGINIKEELKRILNDIYNQGEEWVTETNEIKNYTNQILDKMLKTITNEELEAVLCLE